MQIRLTVLAPHAGHGAGRACDVLVTAPAGTALSAVASALATAVAGPDASTSGTTVLYAGRERLDTRRCALGEPPLVDGAVLTLQVPGEDERLGEEAQARLHVVAGPDAGGVHLLHGGPIRVGRSLDADVPLDDPDVSRVHCTVTVGGDGRITVADLGSTNGTTLDGAAVGARPVRLLPGALLRLGESALRLAEPGGCGTDSLATAPDGEGHLRVDLGRETAATREAEAYGTGASSGAGGRGGSGARYGGANGTDTGSGIGSDSGAGTGAGADASVGSGRHDRGAYGHGQAPAPGRAYELGHGHGAGARPEQDGHGHRRGGPAPGTYETYGAGSGTVAEPGPGRGLASGAGPRSQDDTHGGSPTHARAEADGRDGEGDGGEGHSRTRQTRRQAPLQASRGRRGIGAWARRFAGAKEEELPATAEAGAQTAGASSGTALAAGRLPSAETWPDPAAVLLTALGPGPRLWERSTDHPEALVVRLGTTDRAELAGVPVTVGLREVGSLGLAGPGNRLAGLARSVVAQLAALHAPSDLEIVLISADRNRSLEERRRAWGWLGWLPHLRPAHGQDCRLLLAYDRDQAHARTSELTRRLDDGPLGPGWPSADRAAVAEAAARHEGPVTIVIVDGDPGSAALRETTARLAGAGRAAGIHLLCLAEAPAASPVSPVAATYESACAASLAFRECGAVALLSGDVATALRLLRTAGGRAAGHGTVGVVDAVSVAWAERFARALAPLRTDAPAPHGRASAAALPRSARLLDELGLARATPASLMARWASASDGTAVLGAGPRGPVSVDLTQEGPHLLIEGPAGSGRTELLRSIAASLAAGGRPDRLGLLLVDGAGGERGEGLAACTELPHVTEHLVASDPVRMREFAQALGAELKRRAEILGDGHFADRRGAARLIGQRTPSAAETVSPGARTTARIPDARTPGALADTPSGRVSRTADGSLTNGSVTEHSSADRATDRSSADRTSSRTLRTGAGAIGARPGAHDPREPQPVGDDLQARPSGRTVRTGADELTYRPSGRTLRTSDADLGDRPSTRTARPGADDLGDRPSGRLPRRAPDGETSGRVPHPGGERDPHNGATLHLRTDPRHDPRQNPRHDPRHDPQVDPRSEPRSEARAETADPVSGAGGTAAAWEAGAPLPRLVVLVDDFDALVAPALGSPGRPAAGSVVRALEAVARSGERLGVHLIAASARPDRTADTELAHGARLRVVLDAAPVAAGPDDPAPGRGRLGHPDGRVTPFQTGRVTGRIPRTATLRPTVVPLEWERMGDPPTRRPVRELGNGPTDLALLASALDRAARSVDATPVPPLTPAVRS
ncbi:FHA domain-containing protein [Streptomyces sp. ISL-36]|uniref:FtsK/SpoIIIE domain-containing protein n=1 Tax=Streptomyces sp. ISL-36 TaxID=2819182 RepID=UPI001BE92C54|nr:FtsK/SpoIIIE domain-containing protein [Streptomyces sp. ISL-36]MBT2442155.1 FHA domain-containing protein [Streptomyces sp. ISL-36]